MKEKRTGKVRKALGLIIPILLIGFLIFYLKFSVPFMGIAGRSMEPELRYGDLILTKNILGQEVKVGDIIVFTIPSAVREYYNYPTIVAHRVIEVIQKPDGIIFQTKGDNTGEDPFIVRVIDMRGIVVKNIPYLGFLLFFLQSWQGIAFLVILFLFFTLESYSYEIVVVRQNIGKQVFRPILEKQNETEESLKAFATAMNHLTLAQSEYGENLKSHTGAIKSLAETAENLSKTTAEFLKVVEKLDKKLSDPVEKPD